MKYRIKRCPAEELVLFLTHFSIAVDVLESFALLIKSKELKPLIVAKATGNL